MSNLLSYQHISAWQRQFLYKQQQQPVILCRMETPRLETTHRQTIKEMQIWTLAKPDLEVRKRKNNKYLTHAECAISSELRCHVNLQASEE